MGAGSSTQGVTTTRTPSPKDGAAARRASRRGRQLRVYQKKEVWRPDMGMDQVGAVLAVHRLPQFFPNGSHENSNTNGASRLGPYNASQQNTNNNNNNNNSTSRGEGAVLLYGWYVQDLDHPGQWEPYSHESSERLELAYLAGQSECTVVHHHRTYTVDLTTMQQVASSGMSNTGGNHTMNGTNASLASLHSSPLRGSAVSGGTVRSRQVKRVAVERVVDPQTGNEVQREIRSGAVDPFADSLVDSTDTKNNEEDNLVNEFDDAAELEQGGADLRVRLQKKEQDQQQHLLQKQHEHEQKEAMTQELAGGTRLMTTPLTSVARAGPTLLRTIQAHHGPLFTMALAPQGGLSGSLVLGNSATLGGTQSCSAGTLTLSAGTVLTAGKGEAIVEWDLASASVLTDYDAPLPANVFVLAANYDSQGGRLVAGFNDKTARMYTVGQAEPTHTLQGHTHKVYDAKFTLDDAQIVTAAMDGCVCRWDGERGELLRHEKCSGSHLFSLALSKLDAAVALTAGNDALLNVHDFRQPRSVVGRIAGHTRTLWSCDLSSDDVFYASAGMDCTVRVWDSRATRQPLHILAYHDGPVHHVHFTPHDRGVLSSGKDGAVVLANLESGDAAWKARAHKTAVFRVCYHYPSRLMLTCSVQGVVGVWQWDAGEEW